MRVMVMVKANKETEAGILPSKQLLADMTRFNEELAKAGVLIDAAGLKASSHGARLQIGANEKERVILDGPFTESKELIAGYWLWEVKSLAEAIAWAKRSPNPHPGHKCEIEIRPLFEASDFEV